MPEYKHSLKCGIISIGRLGSLSTVMQSLVQCGAACTPFKNSPGTYATCCKQHAPAAKPKTGSKTYPLTAYKPVHYVSGDPDILTSLQRTINGTSFAPTTKPLRPNVTNITNYYPQASPTTGAPGDGSTINVGCSPPQGIAGSDISNTECHDASSGEKNIPREESHIHQPDSGNFKYSTIVTIPCDEKPDDVTIEFNGKEHSGT
jgi:hypothetical protein